jgi:8-oxo-dGTP diphosphatase
VEPPPNGDASMEATARRELVEEVSVEVGAVEYVHSRTFVADDGTACPNVVTLCEHEAGETRPRVPDEVAAVGWYVPDEIRDHPDAPGFLERDVERLETCRRERNR